MSADDSTVPHDAVRCASCSRPAGPKAVPCLGCRASYHLACLELGCVIPGCSFCSARAEFTPPPINMWPWVGGLWLVAWTATVAVVWPVRAAAVWPGAGGAATLPSSVGIGLALGLFVASIGVTFVVGWADWKDTTRLDRMGIAGMMCVAAATSVLGSGVLMEGLADRRWVAPTILLGASLELGAGLVALSGLVLDSDRWLASLAAVLSAAGLAFAAGFR